MKLTERIYLVGGGAYGYSATGDCNVYMIDGIGSLALVDTGGGNGAEGILENVRRMGFDPANIEIAFITHSHYDHIGGNKAIKEATDCEIAAHETEARDIEGLGELTLYSMAVENGLSFEPTQVDRILKGGEKLIVGKTEINIIHTPGHTPGGISLVMNDEDHKCLFPGDTASAQGRLGFINGPGFDLNDWKDSIKKMLSLRPEMMFPGHGVFVLSRAMEHLIQYDEKLNAPWTTIVTAVG